MRSVATVVATARSCPIAAMVRPRRALRALLALLAFTASILATSVAQATLLPLDTDGSTFSLAIGTNDPVEINLVGSATINSSGAGVNVSALAIPQMAFAGTASLVIYNAAPISGILLAGGATTYYYHLPAGPNASLSVTSINPTGFVTNAAGAFSGAPL